MGGGSHRYHRFQPRSLAGWLGGLAADDLCHHFPGGDSGGVRGEMHPVPSPDAGPVDGGQFLRVRLERTKKLRLERTKFYTGLTRAAKANKQTKEGPLSYVLLESHLPQFQQSAGVITPWFLWMYLCYPYHRCFSSSQEGRPSP
jgi:hypothetical protein